MDEFKKEEMGYDLIEQGCDVYGDDFKEKLIEIMMINSMWDYPTPKISSPILFLSTFDEFNEDLKNISDNYEFVYIDSTHRRIIAKDVYKITKYFSTLK